MAADFLPNRRSSPKGSKPPNQKRAPLQPQPAKLKTHCLNCSATNPPCPLSNSLTSCASSAPPITRTQPKKPSCPSNPYPIVCHSEAERGGGICEPRCPTGDITSTSWRTRPR